MGNTQMKPAELLEQVNKAIAAVLVGGQSYKIGSRSLTRADLSMLKHICPVRTVVYERANRRTYGHVTPITYQYTLSL